MSDFLNLMLDPSSGGGRIGGGGSGTGGGAPGFAPEQDATLPSEIVQAYGAMLTKAPPKPQDFEQRWSAWGSAFGGTSNTNGNPVVGSNNVTASDYGFGGGADYRVSRDTALGFAFAGSGTNWNLAQGLGSGRSDAFQAGVYAKTHSGPWYVSAALAFTNNWFTTNRIAAMGDQLQAKFQGQSYGGRIETGYRYALPVSNGLAGFTPYAAVQAQSFHTPSYSEADLTGGGFGLTYNAMSATDTRGELGARFDDLTMLGTMPLILRARLAWAHDWISNPALDAAFQALPGASFIVNGAAPPKNSALTSLGAELRMTENWSLLGKFDGQFGNGAQTYGGSGTLRYSW
jgi:outer membrane autotransporter protein